MKLLIVEDGLRRLEDSPEFQARLEELRRRLEKKYRPALEQAGWGQRLVIRWRRHREYHLERARMLPSDQTLYYRS